MSFSRANCKGFEDHFNIKYPYGRKSVIYFKQADLLYVIMIKYDSTNKKVVPEKVDKEIEKLLQSMSDTIDIVYGEDDVTDFMSLPEIIDEIINEINN